MKTKKIVFGLLIVYVMVMINGCTTVNKSSRNNSNSDDFYGNTQKSNEQQSDNEENKYFQEYCTQLNTILAKPVSEEMFKEFFTEFFNLKAMLKHKKAHGQDIQNIMMGNMNPSNFERIAKERAIEAKQHSAIRKVINMDLYRNYLNDFIHTYGTPPEIFECKFQNNGMIIEKIKIPYSVIVIPKEINGIPVIEIGDDFLNNQMGGLIVIPDTVRRIGNRAFKNCTTNIKVRLPNQLLEIGEEAFLNCSNITILLKIEKKYFQEIYSLPNSVRRIGREAFKNTGLKLTKLPDSLVKLRKETFSGCKIDYANLEKFRKVPDSLFSKCEIGTLIIGRKTEKIASNAFNNAVIKKITISDPVQYIGKASFANTKVNQLTLPDSLTYIDDEVFINCNISQINLPKSISYIGHGAFKGSNIKSIVIPDSVRNIGECVFANCKNLESVTLPYDIMFIPSYTFANCTNLKKIKNLPDLYTKFGEDVFVNCVNLSSEIKSKLRTIGYKGKFSE